MLTAGEFMDSIIFVGHDAAGDEETRRQVRARAAEHSHRIGPRKPKARRKRTGSKPEKEERPDLSRRGSSISVATSNASGPRPASEDQDDQALYSPFVSPAVSPPIPRLGHYTNDPFSSYPVPAQPWYPELLDYLWQFMLRGWHVLPTTPEQQAEAMLWVKRLTMQDPTYFHMNMLSAMGDLVSRGRRDPRLLVWLTGQVVSTINQALSDRARSLAVGTILAVGRLALREIMVGDMNAGITFHRPAFARMLVMAGGVEGLRLPALVVTHLAWGERLMCRKTGTKISEIEPGLRREVCFDSGGADAEKDIEVLDQYLPYRSRRAPVSDQRGVATGSPRAQSPAYANG